MERARITIIGLGQVGNAFLKALLASGEQVVSVFNRTEVPENTQQQFKNIRFKKGLPTQKSLLGDLIFITVSDDAIQSVANRLAKNFASFKNTKVIHCSGTHSSKILKSLQQKGAQVASFHPMKAITTNTDSFADIWFDIEGEEEILPELEELATNLNAHSFRVSSEAKPFLHASAVVASNYLVVLADLISRISAKGNISGETVLKALTPLMKNTIDNINELGVVDALTGPIARGDVTTIKHHLEALKNDSDLTILYKILGSEGVKIANQKEGANPSLKAIKELLS